MNNSEQRIFLRLAGALVGMMVLLIVLSMALASWLQ